MYRPTIRSHNISNSDLLDYCNLILLEMQKNSHLFPNPEPSLPQFAKVIEEFRTALVEAEFRDVRARALRDKKRKELLEHLRYLSLYVHLVAKGDEEVILASGFIPSKPTHQRSNSTPSVEGFRLKATIGTGSIKAEVKAWRNVRLYQFDYRKKDTEGNWETALSSKSRCIIKNLQIREEYEFRARYLLRNGQSPYSQVISSYVY